MNPIVDLTDLRFAYPDAKDPVIERLNLAIRAGSFNLLAGPSGSGKSTILRVHNGLIPHFSGGRFGGTAIVAGRDIRTHGPRQMSDAVGFVFQDPEPQMIADRVDEEICFGLEQRSVPRHIMRQRLEDMLDMLGIAHLRHRAPQTLSGGEQQRVAIASAMILHPDLLLLDEPTSQLDPAGADAVIDVLTRMHEDLGVTIMMSEHRLDRLLSRVDRVIALDINGTVVADGDPTAVVAAITTDALPPVTRLGIGAGWPNPPLTVNQARRHPGFASLRAHLDTHTPLTSRTSSGKPLIEAQGVSVHLAGTTILRDIDLTLPAGEIVAVMGRNGSGKSTLLRTLLGYQEVQHGQIRRDPNTPFAWLPQQPGSIFFKETVAEEIAWTLKRRGSTTTVTKTLETFDLLDQASTHPRDLSGGERERAAMAAVLAGEPPIVMLDEPTRGMDAQRKIELEHLLRSRRDTGALVMLATHDAELVASIADRVIVLGHGEIVTDGPPREVLTGSLSLAPQMSRLFGPPWMTVDDVLRALPPH